MIFPFPHDSLFPNKKNGKHWAVSNKHKKSQFELWYYTGKQNQRIIKQETHIYIEITPPNKKGRAPDTDNTLSALKSGLDGLAMAWGIDDKLFNPITIKRLEKNGAGKIFLKIDIDNLL